MSTFNNFESNLGTYVNQNKPFDTLYVISPMREKAEAERRGLMEFLNENNKVSANSIQINDLLENISMKTFLKFLIKLNGWRSTSQQPMAQEMYVSIPIMAKNFCIIDFDLEEEQYNAVTQWCNENKDKIAIPLRHYIDEHQDEIA